MKVLLVLALAALAAAEYGSNSPPDNLQLATGLQMVARRFLKETHPKEVEIGDALDIKWRRGMLSSVPYTSSVQVTAEGEDRPSFSHIYTKILPEQKGFENRGKWMKQDKSDLLTSVHSGSPVKVHMLTDGGIHKEVVIGNPYYYRTARFAVHIPKGTFATFESLSEHEATFVSFVSVPAWSNEGHNEITHKEMETKFPQHSEFFNNFAKAHHHDDDEKWQHQDEKKDCHLEDLPIFRKRLLKH